MSRSIAKQVAVLAMSNETPEQQAGRAADLRKQADAAESQAHEEEDAGNGEEAIELRATAHRQRNLAAIVDPSSSSSRKPAKRSRGA